jgi:hypothetical protein
MPTSSQTAVQQWLFLDVADASLVLTLGARPVECTSARAKTQILGDGVQPHRALTYPLAVRHCPQFELYLQGQAVDVKEVGRELGVRYVLEGSKASGRIRIIAQLIDALTGTHLLADRFNGSLDDVFDVQDKVACSVAGVVEPTWRAAEIRRSVTRPTNDLNAYDLYSGLQSPGKRIRSSRRWTCSGGHSNATRVMVPLSLRRRAATTPSTSPAGQTTPMRTVERGSLLRVEHFVLPGTIRAP